MAALANTEEEMKQSQYHVLELWQGTYDGALLIMLPDTYGTTQFLENAPDWTADWTGQRVDSKDPYVAGDEYIRWLETHHRNPKEKLLIASDGLDVDEILGLHAYFSGTLQSGSTPADFRGALAGKQMVLFFEKASLRTRLTFEAGMASLGGTSLFVDQTRSRLNEREPIKDIARNIER